MTPGGLPWRRAAIVGLVAALLVGTGVWWSRNTKGPRVDAWAAVHRPLTQTLLVTGRVAPPARADLGAQVQSTVVEVLVEEGDEVQEGQLLVRLADDEALARRQDAQAQVDEASARLARVQGVGRQVASEKVRQAEVRLEEAQAAFDRADLLYRTAGTAEADHDAARQALETARSQLVAARLEAAATDSAGADTRAAAAALARAQAALALARAGVERTQLRAPSAGRVLQRSVEVGQVVRPGDMLVQFAGEGDLEVRIAPDELHLGALRVGLPAMVATEAFPDRPLQAEVIHIAPQVDPRRGTIEVRLGLVDEIDDLPLRPDMSATVEVVLGQKEQALVLPTWLVRDLGTSEPWVLVDDEGTATRRSVRLGLRGTDAVEVLDGIGQDAAVIAPDADAAPGEPVRTRPAQPSVPVEG